MRRSLAILLMLVFGLGPLSATLKASDDSSLPACCRRHGAHHCAMMADRMVAATQDRTPAFSAPATCPYYPGAAAIVTSPAPALAAKAAPAPALNAQAYVPAASPIRVFLSSVRTHTGRGPPTRV